MIDEYMFPGTYPWNHLLDSRLRMAHVVEPTELGDPAGYTQVNRRELVELGTVYGREGDDWQNPYVWQGRGVLVYPSEHSPGLVPTFGIGVSDDYADVVNNVRMTSHLAVINV